MRDGLLWCHKLHDAAALRGGGRRSANRASGILRLAKKYGDARLENACARCVAAHARSYRSVESVLKNGLDAQPVSDASSAELALEHENVRGPDYFVN